MSNTNIGMLKWYNSKSVVLVTNCITSGMPDTVRQWNKNKKVYEKVSIYLCKGTKDGEINLVSEMKSLGTRDELVAAKSLILFHAESILYKVNYNAAESYNSILAKFIGGKRVNFSMRGSYSLRCNAAVT